jgi:hypothetical protein
MKNPLLCLVSLLLGCGCSFFLKRIKLNYTRDESYSSRDFKDQKLFMAPLFLETIFAANPEDVIHGYPGENIAPEKRLFKYYRPIFIDSLNAAVARSKFHGLQPLPIERYSEWIDLPARDVDLKVGDDSIVTTFRIPDAKALESRGFKQDILILIERLELKTIQGQIYDVHVDHPGPGGISDPYMPKTVTGGESSYLVASAKVVVWDYRENRGILYGTVTEKTLFRWDLGRKHWNASAGDLAKKIIQRAKYL